MNCHRLSTLYTSSLLFAFSECFKYGSFNPVEFSTPGRIDVPSLNGDSVCERHVVSLIGAEVGELELYAEVSASQQGHDLLEDVAVLGDYADGVALNGGLGL